MQHFMKYGMWALGLVLLFMVGSDPVFAQIENNSIDALTEPFKGLLPQAEFVKQWAVTLFLTLMTIEFVYSGFVLIMGGSDLSAFGRYLVTRVFIIALATGLYNSGDLIANLIRATMGQVGANLGGVEPIPSNIIEQGIALAQRLAGDVSWWDGPKGVPIIIAALVISVIFGMVAANMVVVLIEVYVLTTLGAFLLGFMGASITRDYAIAYWRYVFAVSVKLAIMQIIVGIGFMVVEGWFVDMGKITSQGVFVILSTVLVIATLTRVLPDAAQNLVSGTTGGGFGGVAGTVSQLSSVANSMRQTAGAVSSAAGSLAKSAANTALATKAAASAAKGSGATGAAVASGAAANIAKAVGQEVGKSVRGVNGPVAARQSFSQRVNRNLTKEANKS